MNKKKGFTLVEILAVVIILGIVSVIIYPVLNKTLKDNRKKAFEASLNAVVRAAELYKTDNNNTLGIIDYDDGTIDISNLRKWEAGTLTDGVDTDGLTKVYLAGFYDGEFCASGFGDNFTTIEGNCVETPNLCFMVEDNTLIDYGFDYSVCPTDINIPTTILGEDVLYIGEGVFENSMISSVVIPNSVIEIRQDSFYDSALTSLDLTNATSLEYIGYQAFEDTYLGEVDFSNLTSLVYLEEDAFATSNLLGDVDLSNSLNLTGIGFEAFDSNQISSVELDNISTLEYIDDYAFVYNNITGNLNLSNLTSLSYIGENSFYENYISSIDFTNLPNLVEIGDNAFYDNSITGTLNLTNLPKLIELNEEVFRYNDISSVNFSGTNSLEGFDFCVFCDNEIETLTFDPENNVQWFGGWSFAANQLKSLNFSTFPHLWYVGSNAFNDNQLPDSEAFIYYLDGTLDTSIITSYAGAKRDNIVIPSNVVEIGGEAFGEQGISSIDFSQATNLQHINNYAFWRNNLTSVSIPNTVTSIGNNAFYNNPNLTAVAFSNALTSVGQYAFQGDALGTITLPGSLVSISNYAFYNAGITNLTMNAGTTTIGQYAFQNNTTLSSVTFPSTLTSVGNYAFQGDALGTITLPGSLVSISNYAFYNSGITNLTISAGTTTIGQYAFASNRIIQGNAIISNTPSAITLNSTSFYSNGADGNTNITPAYIYDDDIDPVITMIGASSISIQAGATYVDPGATAVDNIDGDITDNITTTSTINANVIGTYTVTYSVSDYMGNIGTAIRTVNVVDTTAPVIAINGINPTTVSLNGIYTEVGATVTDNVDQGLVATATGTVNTSVLGTYTITYTAADTHGNVATPVTRTVNVINAVFYTMANRLPVYGIAGSTYPPTGWTGLQNASSDDAYTTVPLPFSVNIYGTAYSTVYVSSNSYITFGGGSSSYSSLSITNPAYRKLFFGASDNSYQRVSYYSSTTYTRIRYEGTASTSGTAGSPTIVVELTIFNPAYTKDNFTIIEMLVGNHSRIAGVSNISNATGSSYTNYTLAASTSYIFLGDSSGSNFQVFSGATATNVNY